MKPLRTRDELLDLAATHAPTAACTRVIRQNGATVFRGVTSPEGFPGWIVQARGRHRSWLIGVWIDEAARTSRITYPDSLPESATLLERNWL